MRKAKKDVPYHSVNVPVYVSMSDLMLVKPLVEAQGVEWCLKEVFGFDDTRVLEDDYDSDGELTAKGGLFYHSQLCQHRNRQGVVVKCERFSGYERVDKEWLKTRYASDDVKLYAKGDQSLVEEMAQMSKRLGG